MDSNKILVLDGRSLASLAIVRSLGSKGYEIHCGESFKNNLTSFSKYVKKKFEYPSPAKKPDEFIDWVLNLVKQEDYDLVLPVRDDTTLLLAKYQNVISEYTTLYTSDYEKIRKLNDKAETIKVARKADVPIPETYLPEETDIGTIKKEVDYPVLIRPRIGSGARGIKYISSEDQFDSAYHHVKDNYADPIIQEYISHEGGHYSIGTLFNRSSENVATHVYLETKQYPINGGPAVTAESVKKPPWTKNMLRILEELDWIGPAHMDVLYDETDDSPKLLEVNPRFWMSMNIAIKSGVDFPYLIYKLSQNEEISGFFNYEDDMKYRWVIPNELLWLLNTNQKIDGLKEVINFWERDVCYGTLSKDDPFPIIGAVEQGLNFFFEKEKRDQIFDRGW